MHRKSHTHRRSGPVELRPGDAVSEPESAKRKKIMSKPEPPVTLEEHCIVTGARLRAPLGFSKRGGRREAFCALRPRPALLDFSVSLYDKLGFRRGLQERTGASPRCSRVPLTMVLGPSPTHVFDQHRRTNVSTPTYTDGGPLHSPASRFARHTQVRRRENGKGRALRCCSRSIHTDTPSRRRENRLIELVDEARSRRAL